MGIFFEFIKNTLNFKYIGQILFLNLIQMTIVKTLFDSDLSMSLGYKLLYYNSMGYKIFCIFPFMVTIYLLIKKDEIEIEIGGLYKLCRYRNFKKWGFDYFRKNFFNHFLIFLLTYIISFFLEFVYNESNLINIIYLGFFYIINNTLCFTCVSLIYAIIYTHTHNASISAMLLLACIINLCIAPLIFKSGKLCIFILLLPIIHYGIFDSRVAFWLSLCVGIAYTILLYKMFSIKISNLDILK